MAGVDIANQFPNSAMARAVKMGQSQIRSVDQLGLIIATPGQINVDITSALGTALTIPAATGNLTPVNYAILTAIGGPLYATYDGSVPSAANYDVLVQAGGQLPVTGPAALAAVRVFGTTMSVSYWR